MSDNAIDAVKAGSHAHQKLSEEAVKVIKWMLKHKPKHGLGAKLARMYKVSPRAVSDIKNGSRWGWVKIPENINSIALGN